MSPPPPTVLTTSLPYAIHASNTKKNPGLDWLTRLYIALNAARGLEYLHTDCQPRIIHRDVKSSNILLDKNMVAKVADFGISKQAPDGKFTIVDTLLKGTFGYMDPEYFTSQRLTQKSDVYSSGVVLLEIISRRNPFFAELPDGTSGTLIQWVRSAVNYGSPIDIVDPSLKGEFNEDAMTKVVSLAIGCIDPQTARRPDMGHVVRTPTEAIELEPFSRATFNIDCATNGSIVYGKEISQDDRDFSLLSPIIQPSFHPDRSAFTESDDTDKLAGASNMGDVHKIFANTCKILGRESGGPLSMNGQFPVP